MGSTTVQAAPARDYAQETSQTLQNQINLAPQLYQSEAQYQPLYNQLQLQNTQQSLLGVPGGQMGLLDIYGQALPQYGQISAAANTQQRAADIADVQNLGLQASQAFMTANPELAASLQQAQGFAGPQQNQYSNLLSQQLAQQQPREDIYAQQVGAAQMRGPQQVGAAQMGISQQVNAAQIGGPQQVSTQNIRAGNIGQGALGSSLYNQALNAGPSRISSALESAVMNQMSPDGSLTPAEMRQAEQQVRASYAARGMAMSPQAISAEVQNRLVNQRQRQVENLGMAQNVNAQLQQEQAANRNFAGNIYGQDIGLQGQNVANRMQAQQLNQQYGLQAQLANQSAGMTAAQANQQALMQSQLANQQAGLTVGQANQQALMQSQLANQQTGLTVGQANQQALMQSQLANQQTGLTVGQANQQALMQSQLANQAAGINVGQSNQQALMQSQLANQQAGLTVSEANQRAMMQAQLANQQANLGAAESNRASNQQQYQNYIQNLGQGSQLASQELAANRGYAAQMVGLRQATASDPFQAILGRPSTAFQASQGLGAQGMQNTQMAGPSLFNPESSYANNIYGGNQQATNAANMASAANKTALIGGAMGLAGNLAKMCWVAREVYGENNPRWVEFRTWLLTRSPNWFKKTYEKYGPRFAQFISNKPTMKRAIRFWMDSRIATLSA